MPFLLYLLVTQASLAGYSPDAGSCYERAPARDAWTAMLGFGAELDGRINSRANKGPPTKLAAVYGLDDRDPVSVAIYPWRTIGQIIVKKSETTQSTCTGTLVGPCHVLTNAHCLERDASGAMKAAEFHPHLAGQHANAVSAIVSAFDANDPETFDDDWAILKLDAPIGDDLGWMGVRAHPVADGSLNSYQGKLNASGHSADVYGGKMSNASSVRTYGTQENFLLHDGDSFKGASGGPIWFLDSEGDGQIVGIMARTFTVDDKTNRYFPQANAENASRGILSSAFVKQVQKAIDEGCY